MKEDFITEIIEKTIGTLLDNKSSLMSISDTLKEEYSKKRAEIHKINEQLPELFLNTKKLRALDRQLRNKLLEYSSKFSAEGYQQMEALFNEVNRVHDAYLKAEQKEYMMVRRRDSLELELKQSISTIEKAENIVQQFCVSISYLKHSLSKFTQQIQKTQNIQEDELLKQSLELLTYVENEKLRIARDLHDGPAQQIVGMLLNVELCSNIMQKDTQKGQLVLASLKKELSSTLSEIRTILHDLNVAPLEQLCFKEAIQHILDSVFAQQEINIHFFCNLEEEQLSKEMQKAIYRIVQELINNVKKHAKAKQVMLKITKVNQFVYVHVMDNGVGFSVPEDLSSFSITKRSYGLSNICARIKEMKGTITVNSDAVNGTSFKIQLPANIL